VPGELAGIPLDFRATRPATAAERRGLKDRRSGPTRCLSRYTLTGRRRAARRESEAADCYTDRYELRYPLMIGIILVLCVLDYGMSVRIHQWGGAEINRLAAGLIHGSPVRLLMFKLGLTSTGLVFLLLHKNFKLLGWVRAGDVIAFVLAVYLALCSYEVYAVLFINRILAAA
jgi:hypothetical protein